MERILRVADKNDAAADRIDWLGRPVSERIAAVETMRRISYSIARLDPLPRLERVISMRPLDRPS